METDYIGFDKDDIWNWLGFLARYTLSSCDRFCFAVESVSWQFGIVAQQFSTCYHHTTETHVKGGYMLQLRLRLTRLKEFKRKYMTCKLRSPYTRENRLLIFILS
jgi:hypothetical protein